LLALAPGPPVSTPSPYDLAAIPIALRPGRHLNKNRIQGILAGGSIRTSIRHQRRRPQDVRVFVSILAD
jgi:hypothetical protein